MNSQFNRQIVELQERRVSSAPLAEIMTAEDFPL